LVRIAGYGARSSRGDEHCGAIVTSSADLRGSGTTQNVRRSDGSKSSVEAFGTCHRSAFRFCRAYDRRAAQRVGGDLPRGQTDGWRRLTARPHRRRNPFANRWGKWSSLGTVGVVLVAWAAVPILGLAYGIGTPNDVSNRADPGRTPRPASLPEDPSAFDSLTTSARGNRGGAIWARSCKRRGS
jgi:hypothetical protein